MDKLVFKRKKTTTAKDPNIHYRVRCSMDCYNKVVEIAEETGLSIREVVDKMINFASDKIIYESEEN